MKTVLKIIFAPVLAVFSVILWFLTFLVHVSGSVLGVIGILIGVLGLGVLILDSVKNGIIILVIAYLISPYGLPMLAALLIGQLQRFRCWMKDAIYG